MMNSRDLQNPIFEPRLASVYPIIQSAHSHTLRFEDRKFLNFQLGLALEDSALFCSLIIILEILNEIQFIYVLILDHIYS
jgi:hypothetical protein